MNFIKKSIFIFLGLSTALAFQSCSDWNDVTPKNPNYELVKDKDPEAYQNYLENLREYRNSDHKTIYAWFDNSEKQPASRFQHISNLPDSIDVIILTAPDNLNERELKEIAEVREKGTKVIYTLDYDAIKNQYKAYVESESEKEEPTIIDRSEFISKELQTSLKLTDKYNYDGILFNYVGKSYIHMEEDEKADYLADELLFVNFSKSWMKSHTDSYIAFSGAPQNLIDRSMLIDCKHIIVDTSSATNEAGISYNVALAGGTDIPSDRYIVTAKLPSKDPEEAKVGYWNDGSNAVTSTATWATGNFTYTVAGIGIIDIQNDYHSLPRIYANTRDAIGILNPSLK